MREHLKMRNINISIKLIVIVLLFSLEPLIAQTVIEEITVTARNRAENLQEVPLAISVFTSEQLDKATIKNINDLANYTSNMTFNSSENGRLNIPVIRGMGMIDTRGFDNNVSIFLDGVFVSGRSSQNVSMLDLERVEVVKGPQSALYGRNSFSGAINYVTKKPNDEFLGKVTTTVDLDNIRQVIATLSGPIIEGKLYGSLALDSDHDGGTYINRPIDREYQLGGHDNENLMATLRYTPDEATDIIFSAFHGREDIDQLPISIDANNCGEYNNPSGGYDKGAAYYHCGEINGSGTDEFSMSPEAYSAKGSSSRFTLKMDFTYDDYNLISTSSYSESDSHGNMDLDRGYRGAEHYGWTTVAAAQSYFYGGPLAGRRANLGPMGTPPLLSSDPGFPAPTIPIGGLFQADTYLGAQNLDQEYLSQEIRIESNSDQRLRWSAGAFYFKSESTSSTAFNVDVSDALEASGLPADQLIFLTAEPLFFPTAFHPMFGFPIAFFNGNMGVSHPVLAQPSLDPASTGIIWWDGSNPNNHLTSGIEKVTQHALFGSVQYDISDQLTITTELRWTNDDRSLLSTKDDFFFSLKTFEAAGVPAYHEVKHDYWDPRVTLSYKATEKSMLYASASHGTRSGGINPSLPITADPSYDPEENWTYEVGAKTTLLNGKLQINAAAFVIDWTDAQFRQILSNFLTTTANSEGLDINGFEIDFIYNPTDNLLIAGGYGYANAEFADGTLWTGGNAFCSKMLGQDSSSYQSLPINCVTSSINGKSYPDMSKKMPKRSSKNTANLAVEYRKALPKSLINDLDGFIRLDSYYRSKQYMDEMNVAFVPDRIVMNFSAGVESGNFDLKIWVRNLLDDDKPIYAQQFGTDFNSQLTVSGVVNPTLRQIGFTGTYRF
ncbi:MAG: TonB-dependent receptor [Gammaproteobacteria bacterium]|jgi:outer membrane receptor protein involved in Fe transport|nr:TonB-dependent receptor [Gammaproteobacteria bacterium]MBT6073898.1 TonB-dependent receptor [Gammaproteobacteria bacterium]